MKSIWYPIKKTTTSHIAWDSQHTHIDWYFKYNHDHMAAADKRPKEAINICQNMKPKKYNAKAWWSVNKNAEKIIA